MIFSEIRMIVVSNNSELYSLIQSELSQVRGVELIINVSSLLNIDAKLVKGKINIVILDLDRGLLSQMQLKQLMEKYRLLFILTGSSSFAANTFASIGIRDFVLKPAHLSANTMISFNREIIHRMELFAGSIPKLNFLDLQKTVDSDQKIIAIAASTGGTEALEKIFRALPQDIPPILVVQHMPSGFTKLFANRLSNICRMDIKEASNNDLVRKGLVLIAPADYHMILARRNSKLSVECFKGNKIHGVMPAADVLFDSIAPIMRSKVVGVILTGMGADGAKGLMKMHLAGAKTIGQNKETCVVYGMPKVAYDLGAIDYQVPIDKIPEMILSLGK